MKDLLLCAALVGGLCLVMVVAFGALAFAAGLV